jgi:polyhydroxybutyrate depolymerase
MDTQPERIGFITGAIVVIFGIAIIGGSMLRRYQYADAAESEVAEPGTIPGTLHFDGRTREYLIHVPPSYSAASPVPLVFVLHGATQSIRSAEHMSHMSAKAEAENFIAVYPSGTSGQGHLPTWNAGACCAYAMEHKVDDVGFLRALIQKIESEYSIDKQRIYFTGISNGAMMSYRVACEMSDVVAAISPVEGAQDIPCNPSAAVSVIIFHGTADHLVPFNGGSTPFQMGSKRTDMPVRDAVAFWLKRDGCSTLSQHEESAELHIDRYNDCQSGAAVALYAIQGGHHMWPGLSISGNHVPATDLMWSFFADHPKS